LRQVHSLPPVPRLPGHCFRNPPAPPWQGRRYRKPRAPGSIDWFLFVSYGFSIGEPLVRLARRRSPISLAPFGFPGSCPAEFGLGVVTVGVQRLSATLSTARIMTLFIVCAFRNCCHERALSYSEVGVARAIEEPNRQPDTAGRPASGSQLIHVAKPVVAFHLSL